MDIVYPGLLLANIFLIVYYRLMIHYHQHGGGQRAGLGVAVSLPGWRKPDGPGGGYWRRYWLAMAAMAVLVAAGLLWRYPYIAAGLRALG